MIFESLIDYFGHDKTRCEAKKWMVLNSLFGDFYLF